MRKIEKIKVALSPENLSENPWEWVAGKHPQATLLAHEDDGVIWGRIENHVIKIAHSAGDIEAPQLCEHRLQQLRVFGEGFETLVWRNGGGWNARTLLDGVGEAEEREYYDEAQLLWGTKACPLNDDFTLLVEGERGQTHAVPVPVHAVGDTNRVKLVVRHYLADEPFARVEMSRLVKIKQDGE